MKNMKKVIAIFLVIMSVACCFAMPVSAAKKANHKIVKWDVTNPGKATPNVVEYSIKGSWWSQKKVTVVMANTGVSMNFDSKSLNFYKNNARFRVDIYKNGTWQRAYTGKLGQYFYLPKGSSNYTVVLKTYYDNWQPNSSACHVAAYTGYCYLKY